MLEEYLLSHYDLKSYLLKKERVAELDAKIIDAEVHQREVEHYMEKISPVYDDMPKGNEHRDKVADMVIKMMRDREMFTKSLESYNTEKQVILYELAMTRLAVSKVHDEQLRKILEWYYLEGCDIVPMVTREYRDIAGTVQTIGLTADGIRKKLRRYLQKLDLKQPLSSHFIPSYSA